MSEYASMLALVLEKEAEFDIIEPIVFSRSRLRKR